MIHIKSEQEINIMKAGGKMLSAALGEALDNVKPGISELELDLIAEKAIVSAKGEPGFKKVEGYKHTTCVSTNDIVVHGIPTKRTLNNGDVIGIDCGVFYDGFHTDMAETVLVGTSKDKEVEKFLKAGKDALYAGIRAVKAGNRVGHISQAMQEVIEREGYSVVRPLVGHGVGRELHEDPEIPGYLDGELHKTRVLKAGMTIAIEIIYTKGKNELQLEEDDWTISTVDGSIAGLFERTVLITSDGFELITAFPGEEKLLHNP